MEDVSRWEVAGSASFYLHFLSRGEVTSSGDRALRCQAPGLRGQNLKDIKRASISKTADLPNVNCHLTSLLTTNNTTTTTSVPPGSCCRSGVERELNQGFSCYKSPSTPAGEQRQADRNKRPRNGTGPLFSRELKTERCSSTNRLGGKGMRRWEINKKLLFFFYAPFINNNRFLGYWGVFNSQQVLFWCINRLKNKNKFHFIIQAVFMLTVLYLGKGHFCLQPNVSVPTSLFSVHTITLASQDEHFFKFWSRKHVDLISNYLYKLSISSTLVTIFCFGWILVLEQDDYIATLMSPTKLTGQLTFQPSWSIWINEIKTRG